MSNVEPLSESARHVLGMLAKIGPGFCLEGPENKYWNRGARELITHGLAEEVCGYFALTDEGRAFIKVDRP